MVEMNASDTRNKADTKVGASTPAAQCSRQLVWDTEVGTCTAVPLRQGGGGRGCHFIARGSVITTTTIAAIKGRAALLLCGRLERGLLEV